MKDLSLNDTVWINYNNNKIYSGIVRLIEQSNSEGVLVTVLTNEWGFRTVPIEKCSFEKPKKKLLSAKQLKN